ncbi:hypothetical protein OG417_07850 [Actinoallomurus sp. NBC_01490]|uniref:site-specific integrase n=1 Tax=Actinoallomurus sp. NBC_01490 TaxID=2903557 RepID=UPI002E3513BA|nr:hypothetical protein [Actinoallomurus sp. NBC_01490]
MAASSAATSGAVSPAGRSRRGGGSSRLGRPAHGHRPMTLGKHRVRARVNVRDYDGETREVTRFGPTQAAAERRLKEALRDRAGAPADGEITADTRLSYAAKLWWAEAEESDDLSAQTKEIYERTLNRIVKALGGLLLREVDVPRADAFIKSVRKNHGPSAAKSAKSVLSLLLGMAVRHGALSANPMRDVAKISTGRRSRPRALTPEEEAAMLTKVATDETAAELDVPDLLEFLDGTGMRIGEALGCAPRSSTWRPTCWRCARRPFA